MVERKKLKFNSKLPCPSCGEKIGFVESFCPFCEERIPFWGDRAGKILISIGLLLVFGYVFSIIYFWNDYSGNGTLLLAGFGRLFVVIAISCGLSK